MSRVREGDVMMETEIRMIVGFEDGGRVYGHTTLNAPDLV